MKAKLNNLQKNIVCAQSSAADGEPDDAIGFINQALALIPDLDTRKLLEKASAEFSLGHPPTGETFLDLALLEADKAAVKVKPAATSPTPGPWSVADAEGDAGRAVVGPDNELIADCYANSSENFNLPEDYRQNARLIAAAPELLAALENLLDDTTESNFSAARSAIARAKGQE